MNAGLGNLDRVKRHLLASSLLGDTTWNDLIADIGQGVAGTMEQFCNRQFARMVGDVAVFQADRASLILPRYPVESILAVETKGKDSELFVSQGLEFIQSSSPLSGVVYLPDGRDAGSYWSQVRITYTGGYWFEQLEPDDGGYPSVQPAGSAALPADLRLAWLIQCREAWDKFDVLGTSIVEKPGDSSATGVLDLTPMTKRILGNYALMNPI